MALTPGETSEYDVVVVGSGAGGLLAAIRAHDAGLRSVVIEKSDCYGGTSAVSGGAIWIPNNDYIADKDSEQNALTYLQQVTQGQVPDGKLLKYLQFAPRMVSHLKELGVEYTVNPFMSHPDYYPMVEGAIAGGRTMFVKPMDGGALRNEFTGMRESYPEFKMMERISMDLPEAGAIMARVPGWRKIAARLIMRYWLDLPWRLRTARDRQLTLGNALIGGLRKAMLDRGIDLVLRTSFVKFIACTGHVTGVIARRDGKEVSFHAARAVILASGGFEQSQPKRDAYFPQRTQANWSATPRGNNTGDILDAARDIGADTEFLDQAWWAPTITMPTVPSLGDSRNIALFFERGYPHSLCVNRLGNRFANEACSYHQFGQAMLRDNAATGANMPCWIIFDATFRHNYPLGGLLPGWSRPDSKLPASWFDHFLFRADSIAALAAKIAVPAAALAHTIDAFNANADQGEDPEFQRGGNFYNQYFGDPANKPHRNLGAVRNAPFYAVRIDLGDLGSKGGPKTDADARVLDRDGRPISGLYAIGNCAGSVMGPAYPGAGATLGSAMTFACAAVANIARSNEP